MVAEQADSACDDPQILSAWTIARAQMGDRIANRFRRAEVRGRVRRYLSGLMGQIARKNGWQVAEAIGEEGPQHEVSS